MVGTRRPQQRAEVADSQGAGKGPHQARPGRAHHHPTFTRAEGGEFTSAIVVESADGGRLNSPQKLLDTFYDALAFDPLEFARMKPKDQFDALKGMVPGVDFAAIEGLNRSDFAKRADRQPARQIEGGGGLRQSPSRPACRRSRSMSRPSPMSSRRSASTTPQLERRKERREGVGQQAARLRSEAEAHRADAEALRQRAAETARRP
jgi:hypothetical protein